MKKRIKRIKAPNCVEIIGFPCILENRLKRHEISDSDADIPASGLDS